MPLRLSLRQRRKEMYLLIGIILGVSVMAIPAAIYWTFGYDRPIYSDIPGGYFREEDVLAFFRGSFPLASPLDAVIEVFWLFVPGFIFVVIFYLLLVRRTHWKGYDEAVKWVRS